MKIYTEEFINFSGLIHSMSSETDDNAIGRSIYFDFEKNWAYFYRDGGTVGRIKFRKEGDFTNMKNFAVDSRKFLFVASQYKEMELSDDLHFFGNGDSYKFFPIIGDDLIVFPEISSRNTSKEIRFFDEEIKSITGIASSYTNPDDQNIISRTVNIKSGNIFAIAMSQIFQGSHESFKNHSISLPPVVQDFIAKVKKPAVSYTIDNGPELFYMTDEDKVVELVTPTWEIGNIPDVTSEGFVANYNHDTYIKVDLKKLKEIVEFLSFFFKQNVNSRVDLKITKENLYAMIKGDDDITKSCPVISSSFADEVEFLLNGSKLMKALRVLKGDSVTIKYDSDKVLCSLWGEDDYFIGIAKIVL